MKIVYQNRVSYEMMRTGLRAYSCDITDAEELAAEPGVEMTPEQCLICLKLAHSFLIGVVRDSIFEFGGIENAANREAGTRILLNYSPMRGGSN